MAHRIEPRKRSATQGQFRDGSSQGGFGSKWCLFDGDPQAGLEGARDTEAAHQPESGVDPEGAEKDEIGAGSVRDAAHVQDAVPTVERTRVAKDDKRDRNP